MTRRPRPVAAGHYRPAPSPRRGSALHSLSLAFANELRGTGIKVNSASPGYVATDLNHHSGVLNVEQGARVPVYLATLDDNGPSGAFISENGTPQGEPVSW